jgi:vacuolar-type H+-ATPase subunit E/Vma4
MRLKKVEDAVRSEATAVVYSATLKAKNELIKAQEEAVDQAFAVAEQRLGSLHQDKGYPKILQRLLDECLEFFNSEVVIQARSDDRALVEKMMAERQVPYRFSDTPLEASGGLVVSSVDGSIAVFNTFESRLAKAKAELRLEISSALFGQS